MGRRPDGNRYRTRDLTRNESFRQIFTTLGWTPPPGYFARLLVVATLQAQLLATSAACWDNNNNKYNCSPRDSLNGTRVHSLY